MTLEDIQQRNREIRESFQVVDFTSSEGTSYLQNSLEAIKHEAAALWLRACDLISGKTFTLENGNTITWNMLPYDVQVI